MHVFFFFYKKMKMLIFRFLMYYNFIYEQNPEFGNIENQKMKLIGRVGDN